MSGWANLSIGVGSWGLGFEGFEGFERFEGVEGVEGFEEFEEFEEFRVLELGIWDLEFGTWNFNAV